jgi:hypothetical protein
MVFASGRSREMPGNYPYGIQKESMEASVTIWRKQTELMVEDISQYITSELKTLVSNHFASVGRVGVIW